MKKVKEEIVKKAPEKFIKVIEIEFDMFGNKRADYELTFSEFSARLLNHEQKKRQVVFRSNNCISVIAELSTYNYYPIVKD